MTPLTRPDREGRPTPTREGRPTPTREGRPTPTREGRPTQTREGRPTPTREGRPTQTRATSATPSRETGPTPTRETTPTATTSALDADWLSICRRATTGLEEMLAAVPTTAQRAQYTGARGEGGDRTLVIDQDAEGLVFAELDRLHADGYRFTAVSEERGEVDYGDLGVRVIIDPIDGSLNAKRGISNYALSIAVADGDTMGDVAFAFVHDFGPSEQWWARRGEGAWCDGHRLDPTLPERRSRDGRLEVLGIEAADPRWVAASIDALVQSAYRLRALGTIASTLCQVAAARFDAMVTLRRSRGVDAAAGQLIVREAGGVVSFPTFSDPLGAPLDAVPSSPLIAARTQETLAQLASIPA